MRTMDRPLIIQRIDETTEEWVDTFKVHAYINKTKNASEYLNAGAIRTQNTLTFEVRYFKDIEVIFNNLQCYRLVYQNIPYNIVDYDDFQLLHKTVKMVGVSY